MQFEPPPKDEANRDVRSEPSPPTSPPPNEEGASCWLCYDEGPDDDGQPLRRDCSCRGSDAGFAHLSCLVGYAKHKSENWDGQDADEFSKPWWECPSCLQEYQGKLAVELVTEFASFAEGNYLGDDMRLLEALCTKVFVLSMQGAQLKEAKWIGERILSDIDQMRGDNRLVVECRVYNVLGYIALHEGGEDGAKRAVECYEKLRDICTELGWEVLIASAESNLATAQTLLEGGDRNKAIEDLIKRYRSVYDLEVAEKQPAVSNGQKLADLLFSANRVIEAERLWTELVAKSMRVHGPEHRLTKEAVEGLEECKERWVNITTRDPSEWFLAFRYEEDGKKCVVKGPIPDGEDPMNVSAETFAVASEDIMPQVGTPVVCQGLIDDQTHLNGKVGDVRSLDESCGCYHIYFEDKDLEPCLVKPKNLRILVELPDE